MSWDIKIHSTLSIDPVSSAKEINKAINKPEFKNQLKAVAVALEASSTQKDKNAFRVSLNKVIREVQGDEKTAKVKVGVELNRNQVIRDINKALTQASKDLKKIKVSIDAQVDKATLERQLSGNPAGAGLLSSEKQVTNEKIKQSSIQNGLNNQAKIASDLNKQQKAEIEANNARIAAQSKGLMSVSQGFTSLKDMANQYAKQFEESGFHIDRNIKEITNLSNGMKTATIEVRKYNDELKRSETFRLGVVQNPGSGKFEPVQLSQLENKQQTYNESVRQGQLLADRTILSYEQQIATGSRVEGTYLKQIAAIKQLQATGTATKSQMQDLINTQKLAIKADNQKAQATELQTKLLHQHTKAMQQNKRFIDKSGMKQLATDIQSVNLNSSNALPQLKAMQGQMTGYVNQAAQATRSQMGIIENFQNAMLKFPIWMGASTLFFGAIRSAREFVSTIIEIDSKMITLQKVMSDSTDMNQVFESAARSAERFGQTLSGVLDAYAEFARQGYEGVDLTNFGDAALITANVGEVSAQQASEYLTSAAAQWQQSSKDAMGNIDSWNEIANNYATTVAKLGEGHAKAGSTARAMGLDFHETNAVLGALTAQTKQSGSEIGNFIKAVFPRAYTVGRGTIEDLGISIEDVTGRTKSSLELFREVAFAIEDMSQAEQAAVVKGIGGVHHFQRMQVLLDTLRETNGLYDQIYQSSVNSAGSAAAENAVYMESLEAQINKAKVSIEMFSLALGEAFLEAGVLEFLTSFADSLTAITKLMNEHPAVYKMAFGVLISLILASSKSVRGLYTALSSLSTIKGFFTPATQQIKAFDTGLKQASQSGRRMAVIDREAARAKKELQSASQIATGASIAQSRASTASTITIGKESASTLTMARAKDVASAASARLGLALRGLMAATGVGLAIAGVTWALEKFINSSAKSTQAASKFEKTTDVLKQSLESDAESVENLVDKHQKLENQIKSGKYNSEQLQEHTETTKELSSLFPDLVAGSEDYGATLANQQGIMEGRIALLKQQIEAEKELQLVQAETARLERAEEGRKAEKQLKDGSWKSLGINELDRAKAQLTTHSRDSDEKKRILDIQTINDLTKFGNSLIEERNRLNAQDPEGNAKRIQELDKLIDTYRTHSTEVGMLNSQVQAGINAQSEQFLIDVQKYIEATEGLENNTGQLFGNIANQIAAISPSSKVASDAYSIFLGKLQEDVGFVEKMKSYETALLDFQKAEDPAERAAAYEQVVLRFQEMKTTVSEAMALAGFDDVEINRMIAGLEAAQVSALGLKGSTFDLEGGMVDLNEATEDVADSTDDVAYAWQQASEAASELKKEINELDKEMDIISKAMEQLAETGSLDPALFAELLEIAPQVADHVEDTDAMLNYLDGRHSELAEQQKKRIGETVLQQQEANAARRENHEKTMQAEADATAAKAEFEGDIEDALLEDNAERLNTDAANKGKAETTKAGIAAERAKGEDKQEADLTNFKSDFYRMDNENYGELGKSKIRVEEQTVNEISGLYGKLAGWIINQFSKVHSWVKAGTNLANAMMGKNTPSLSGLAASRLTPTGMIGNSSSAPTIDGFLATGSFGDPTGANFKKASANADEINKKVKDLLKNSPALTKSINDRAKAHNKLAKAGAGSGKTLKDFDKTTKGAGKTSKKAAKEIKDLGIEVERATKSFTKNTFVLNKHEDSLRKINLQIEKQNLQTQKYATHSAAYRNSLKQENKLNEKKLKVLQQQEKSLSKQIKSGNIKEYGMVGQSVNVGYNKYNVTQQASEGGKTSAKVVAGKSSTGTLAPFAGMRVNHGYSPNGGGNYASQIGFNGGRHYGIDFGGKSGQAVYTPHGGVVVKSGWSQYGGGNQVEVYNKAMDKTFTFMHMLGDLAVKTGQTVQAGQRIGSMGSTGNSTGTHLHFQANHGKGLSNARSVNPAAYLTSSASSYLGANAISGSTSSPAKLGQSISAETASFLNELEQAELEAIENSINQHNAREENKSKVQQAKEARDRMVLERLQLLALIRENEFKIVESQIEQYNYNKDKLNTKIAQLEYKASDVARKAGKTEDSAEWRKYMSQAKASRGQQLAIQEEQVKYIERVLASDRKKSPKNRMNQANRVQLEDRLRDAKEQVISLKRAVDEAETAIITSKVNEAFKGIDKTLEGINKKIEVLTHKRSFIDATYSDGAKKYTDSLKEEIKLQEKNSKEISKSLKTLNNLRKNLKQQPELYEQTTNKIADMERALRDSQLAVHELKKEIKTIELDKLVESLNEALEKSKKKANDFTDKLHYINKDYQPDLYYNTQADILVEMQSYKKTIESNIKRLKEMQKEVKKMPELHKRVTEELKNWEEQQKNVQKEMHTLRAEFATDFVNSIKEIYQKQQDLAIKAIDKEYSEYEKMVNKKLKLIDDTAEEDRYLEDANDKQEELQKLRAEIIQRSGDDSLRNQKILKELREELAEKEREYNRFVDDKEREKRKEALNQELEDAREASEERKENINQVFEDLLNDQRKFNEIQEQIMKGQVDKYKDIYKDLTDFVNKNIKDIGKSISEGLLDGISTPYNALQEIAKLLETLTNNGVLVPESSLKPVAPVLGDYLTGTIKGVSNDLALKNLGLTSSLPSLNNNKQGTSTHTTNNSNTFSSLINIENFRGTQQEKDALARALQDELRKLGVI